jgi:3D-(3,5/4)-trihydroxycyclohexane-1,2-dione acylhydrolase (decyclizing)
MTTSRQAASTVGRHASSASGSVRVTTAQALVQFLCAQYTERDGQRERLIAGIFGIFGHGNVTGLGDAIEQAGTRLPYHQARNEQSMVHAAIGYAKARRRRSALACTSSIGPGATNMVTGAATATINRLPVLLLPGDAYASRRQGNVLQQVEHPVSLDITVNDCFRPVSRFFDRIMRPEQILASLPEAMRVLTDPAETGTVTLALPQDVGPEAGTFPAAFFAERIWRIDRRRPDEESLGQALQALRAARRPLIIAGGGVHYSEAWAELRTLAESVGIPVAETFAGMGAIAEPSPWLVGGIGVEGNRAANALARTADLVLCVGTRLGDFITASRSLFENPDIQLVAINVTAHDAAKMGALAVVGDARESLRALADLAAGAGLRPDPDYAAEVARERAAWASVLAEEVYIQRPEEGMSQGQVIGILNEEALAGDLLIAAAGGPPGDLRRTWDPTGGRDCFIEFGNSCMGHEIPAAIGARLARPAGEILAYIGDGTYLMNPGEIVTAVQDGLKVTVVVVENHGFQVIRRLQLARTGVPFGNEFRARNPDNGRLDGAYLQVDYAANAQSLGARAWHVRSEAELRAALREARSHAGTCAIVVDVEPHRFLPGSGAWWDAAPPEVSTNEATQALRAEYEAARAAQRFHG